MIAAAGLALLAFLLSGCAPIEAQEERSPVVVSGRVMGPIDWGLREDGTVELRIPEFYAEFLKGAVKRFGKPDKIPPSPSRKDM